jgi:hypothetical protein
MIHSMCSFFTFFSSLCKMQSYWLLKIYPMRSLLTYRSISRSRDVGTRTYKTQSGCRVSFLLMCLVFSRYGGRWSVKILSVAPSRASWTIPKPLSSLWPPQRFEMRGKVPLRVGDCNIFLYRALLSLLSLFSSFSGVFFLPTNK